MPTYTCEFCSYTTRRKSNFTKHMRHHTGDKPFVCPVCNKGFSGSSDLSRHKRVHSGERPYTCTFCQKTFAWGSNLKDHLRIHTGEETSFRCSLCGTNFTRTRNFNQHMKEQHPDAQLTTTSRRLRPDGNTENCITHTFTTGSNVMTVSQLSSCNGGNAIVTTIRGPSTITTSVLQGSQPAVNTTESTQNEAYLSSIPNFNPNFDNLVPYLVPAEIAEQEDKLMPDLGSLDDFDWMNG